MNVLGISSRTETKHPRLAHSHGSPRLRVAVSYLQGLYYVATGVWSLVSLPSFERVTGPKADKWLVKTVGVLVIVIGAVLAVAGYRRCHSPEVVALAAGSAVGLAGIDIFYAARRTISPIYLLEAAAELILVAAWMIIWRRRQRDAQ